MKRKLLIGALILVMGALPAMSVSRAQATTLTPTTISVNGTTVTVSDIDLNSYASVETLLLRVKRAQRSTSAEWLNNVSPTIRDAVLRTISRDDPSGYHVTQGFTSVNSTASTSSAVICGWAYKKVSYRPGVITYYWFEHQTWACWDGYRLMSLPTHSYNGKGSWGWSYQGCAGTCSVFWFPSPTAALSIAKGHMHIGISIFSWDRYPYINQLMQGNGWVTTTWHD